jgi:hypothetical protein
MYFFEMLMFNVSQFNVTFNTLPLIYVTLNRNWPSYYFNTLTLNKNWGNIYINTLILNQSKYYIKILLH